MPATFAEISNYTRRHVWDALAIKAVHIVIGKEYIISRLQLIRDVHHYPKSLHINIIAAHHVLVDSCTRLCLLFEHAK